MTHAELSRAFSAGVSGQSDTWSDAPGWHDISAFGANQMPKKFLNFRRSSPSMRVRRRGRAASLTQPASTCTDPVLAGTTIASFGNWPNRLIAQTSVTGTKKHAKMIGHNTSRLMSRPRLNVRAAPSMNIISRSSDCLCSSPRMSNPAQSAISMPAATGPKIWPKFKTPPPICSTAQAGKNGLLTSDYRLLAFDV